VIIFSVTILYPPGRLFSCTATNRSHLAGWFEADREPMLKAFILAWEKGIEIHWGLADDCVISHVYLGDTGW
jgi:hypothetical protein